MISEIITLTPTPATLTVYAATPMGDWTPEPRPAVIVIPGGGYKFLSERAAEPVLLRFFAEGFNAFLLRYTVEEGAQNDQPLVQLALAMRHVRENAAHYHIDPARVFVCGFSAGGHLAASLGTRWTEPPLADYLDGADAAILRPTGMILCYPVITAGRYAHRPSVDRLVGFKTTGDEPEALRHSLEHHVGKHTPPAFIWHTFTDPAVPMRNSLLMASAMVDAGIPCELHIYPQGPHALALANENTANGKSQNIVPHLQGWIDLAIRWAKEI